MQCMQSFWQGSSPHARGTQTVITKQSEQPGIIPACAGNTHWLPVTVTTPEDHPRMRGEHMFGLHEIAVNEGSSPHARGTRNGIGRLGQTAGIIPACAGNTKRMRMTGEWAWDHPRMRGEHWYCSLQNVDCMGSSPHARGTPGVQHRNMAAHGIIPACAGNTYTTRRIMPVNGDHPRMRGEHAKKTLQFDTVLGSSPHARGTLLSSFSDLLSSGIIPACAGNTIPVI